MFSILLILLTVFITAQGNLMYENLTGVSLKDGMFIFVIIQAFLCSIYFNYKMHRLYNCLNQNKKWIHILINITSFTLCIGVLFPYTLNSRDLFSLIHVYCSMFACLSFLVLLFLYTRYLSYENVLLYEKVHWFYDLGLQFLFILFIVFGRVNGYLELLFTILVSVYIIIIEYYQKQS